MHVVKMWVWLNGKLNMKYHFRIHKEGNAFWAKCIELDGCYTQADSMKELIQMMQEALNLYISEPEGSTDIAELPDDSIKTSRNVVAVPVDAEAAKKMGFENVNGYQSQN
jgi:predicted RNase H-like HicB family nuclease